MQTSAEGRALIERFEGLRTTAYLDQRGILTLGYGHTGGVKAGERCTEAEADAWLGFDLKVAESAVAAWVTVDLNQHQFDALTSLAFNIGASAFAHSTLVDLLNQGAYVGAANQFLVWDKVNKVPNAGLAARRMAERTLFLEPV